MHLFMASVVDELIALKYTKIVLFYGNKNRSIQHEAPAC